MHWGRMFIGWIIEKGQILFSNYKVTKIVNSFAEFGEGSSIGFPFLIQGVNPFTPGIKYIHIGKNVSLGANVTIFATRAHVFIGDHSISGPHLTIMTGDHPSDIKGR